MSINIALLFKPKWGAFLSPLSREQAVWGPGGWWESGATLVSLHLPRMLRVWERRHSCFSLALPQDAGTTPGGAAVWLLWALAPGQQQEAGGGGEGGGHLAPSFLPCGPPGTDWAQPLFTAPTGAFSIPVILTSALSSRGSGRRLGRKGRPQRSPPHAVYTL